MSTNNQFCTFYLDGLLFGVEVQKVQEVIRYQDMTRVPTAPKVIRGLINLRGQIVTALDLRCLLELSERSGERLPMNVVICSDGSAVSLLVDEIGDVLEVEDAAFESPPETLQGATRQLIRAVYKLKDRLLMILDTEKAITLNVA